MDQRNPNWSGAPQDGVSQQQRTARALDPATAPIDGRGILDLLQQTCAYSRRLPFVDGDGHTAGDWSGFLLPVDPRDPKALDELRRLADWLENPARFADDAARRERFSRPHLVLYLVLLRLLEGARQRLDGLTERHLRFYYEQVLRLAPRPPEPDRCHLLLELAPREDAVRLPAGTRLPAGATATGEPRTFVTNAELVVNRARIASLKSLHVERRVCRLEAVRDQPELLLHAAGERTQDPIWHDVSGPELGLLAMLELALGDPNKGYLLPPFPDADQAPNQQRLKDLDKIVRKIREDLSMPLADFRELVEQCRKLSPAEEPARGQWQTINDLIRYKGNGEPPDRLETNLKAALGLGDAAYAALFEGTPQVSNIYQLLSRLTDLRLRESLYSGKDSDEAERAREAIKTERDQLKELCEKKELREIEWEHWGQIAAIVDQQNQRWRRVYQVLRTAVLRQWLPTEQTTQKLGELVLNTGADESFSDRLIRLLHAAYGNLIIPDLVGIKLLRIAYGDPNNRHLLDVEFLIPVLEALYQVLAHLEGYFQMSAEDWADLRAISAEPNPTPWQQAEAVRLLEQAHAKSHMDAEIEALSKTHREKGFDAMIEQALGDEPRGEVVSATNAVDPPAAGKSFRMLDPDAAADRRYLHHTLNLDPAVTAEIQRLQKQHRSPGPSRTAPSPQSPSGAATDGDDGPWALVYRKLVEARWRRFGAPRPELVFWDNVFVADDAASVRPDQAAEPDVPWPPFGASAKASGTRAGDIGLAIASPLLALAEGDRAIRLELSLNTKHMDLGRLRGVFDGEPPFKVCLDSPKGMLPIEKNAEIKLVESDGKLVVTVNRSAEDPPVMSQDGITWPSLELLLADRTVDGQSRKAYGALADLRFAAVKISVTVGSVDKAPERPGLSTIAVRTDEGIQDSSKPFLPFGSAPSVGSTMLLGHPELIGKPIRSLRFSGTWMDLPDDGLNSLYEHYDDQSIEQSTFKVDIRARRLGIEKVLSSKSSEVALFKDDTKVASLEVSNLDDYPNPPLKDQPAGARSNIAADDPSDWPSCMTWRLKAPDFQHSHYASVAARKALEAAAAMRNDPSNFKPINFQVEAPYTPKLSDLQIHYCAEATLRPGKAAANLGELRHVEPFGLAPLATGSSNGDDDASGADPYLLPRFPHHGELLIGLADLAPPQPLSLLFQLTAPGPAQPGAAAPEPIRWSILDGDRWRPLDAQQLRDDTDGLHRTGIIDFDLPAAAPSTRLPGDLYWLRAALPRPDSGIGDLVGIHPQAVTATREGLAPGDTLPLPAETISGFEARPPGIAAVSQPYSSFGGRTGESPALFHTRVAERLRHRNRALTRWDYERLVLDAFPEIYRARCLTVDRSQDNVRVLVIPDMRDRVPADPLRPAAPAATLQAIRDCLVARAPDSASISVENPRYVSLQVRIGVSFKRGVDIAFECRRISDALVRLLSPWAFDYGADIHFGNRIDRYRIVDFVERQPGVDFIAGITLLTPAPNGRTWDEVKTDDLNAGDVIYVSALDHLIEPFDADAGEAIVLSGIGYMRIGIDFVVGANAGAEQPPPT